ncbi:MAG: leucine-rich repeat protein [Bacteroidales bacterium]|nr:leucine-rich repeat protein [Bacteroidales bacterium]
MNDCIYISYSNDSDNSNVKQLVNDLAFGEYAILIDFYRKINTDSPKSFGDKLSKAKYIICILSDSYFRSDECMAQWFRIHENAENKKILYVKDDKEQINIGNEKILKNGFDFNDKGRKYFLHLKSFWEQYQNDCMINDDVGLKNKPTAIFLKEHNYCLDELGKIYNRINSDEIYLLSKGSKQIENAISRYWFHNRRDVIINHTLENTSAVECTKEESSEEQLSRDEFFSNTESTVKKIAKDNFSDDQPTKQYDFFISTNSADEEACKTILQLLREQEVSYWYFEEQRCKYDGKDFRKNIMWAIDNSSHTMFLSSEHSNNSTHCLNEISVSIKKAKPIIVIKLDETKLRNELEYYLHHVDHINYKKKNWEKRLIDVCNHTKEQGKQKDDEPTRKKSRIILNTFGLLTLVSILLVVIWIIVWPKEPQYLGTVLVRCDKDVSTCVVRDGTTEIGPGAFEDCKKLKKVTFKHGLQTIASCAFKNCTALESIELPVSVCRINDFAFEGCESLKHFSFGGRHSKLQTVGSNPFVATKGIQMEEINNESICAKNGFLIDKTHKTLISYYGYEDSVFVPDDITTIGSNAFAYNYKIIKITLPEGITNIKYYAFKQCTNLENINIPNTLTELGTNPFVYDKKIKIRLDSNNQSFKYDERYKILIDRSKHLICCLDFINETLNLSLTDIVAINSSAFLGCNLKKIRLPLECKEISFDSFDTSKLKEIRVPTNNRQVILNALQNKKATERDYEKMCNIIKVYDE